MYHIEKVTNKMLQLYMPAGNEYDRHNPLGIDAASDMAATNNRLLNGTPSVVSPSTATSVRGQNYPEIKQTGYYSDVVGPGARGEIGNILIGPTVAQDTLWKVAKEPYTPKASTFNSEAAPIELTAEDLSKLHGPSTEPKDVSVSEDNKSHQDFPPGSYTPKVQLPFWTAPGNCPRKVEIERRKRIYAAMDLNELLVKEGINTDELMPKEVANVRVILNKDPNNPAPFPPFLPLHIFDNEEFDCRNPDEWIALGLDGAFRRPVPGKALILTRPRTSTITRRDQTDPSHVYKWFSVGVLDYRDADKRYLVVKTGIGNRVGDKHNVEAASSHIGRARSNSLMPGGTQFWVPRIRLMFCAEDPEIFAKRVAWAFNTRKHTEALLRYNLYIDCMPMEGVSELDNSSMKRMVEWAKGAPNLAKQKGRLDDFVQLLEKEVNIEFCRSMNRIVFDQLISKEPDTFAFITIPEKVPEKVPERDYPFDEQYDSFAFNSLLTRDEAIQAVGKVRTECNKVSGMSLFHVPTTKHMKLEEFEQAQAQATSQVALFLKDGWITTLRTSIRSSLREVGKGWFNIRETNWEVYQISKMKKIMEMVKFNMQDSLRFLVQDSLINFTQMLIDACHSTFHCKEDMDWGRNVMVSKFQPKRNPLFHIDMIMDNQGVHYSTNLHNYETVLVSLFDRGIQSTQNVPQLEKYIMEDIFFSGTPLLESVGEHEPPVDELRKTIVSSINKAFIPLKAYAKQYIKYLELQNLNIVDYVATYQSENHTAAEVKQEVENHLQEKEVLENTLPSHIIIGPFYVNTDGVRTNLAKKRKALSNAVLELLALQLRKQADDACEIFKSISRKLLDRPNCVEELAEMREWMKTIPDVLAEHTELIDKAMSDYELIEEFYYNLSADDFQAKWTAVGWPYKIEQQMEQTEAQLEEDEERFRKLQLQDQANFNDRLDTLFMVVAGMAAHNDISKSHEIANEVRRIHKQLKEAQTWSTTYNNRERLFSMPVTNYEKLSKLIKDFEPFKNLWITVSDWLKWYDSWMHDPLTSIDAETVEKNVSDAYKTMHKSVKIFQDIPSVADVAKEIKGYIEDFKPNIPLIQGLRNPGMRHRHWEQLSGELGFQVMPKANLTFNKCLDMKLGDHIGVISKIAEVAGKEYAIEQALDKMENEWNPVNFEILAYKETGTYILKASEDVSQLLDDHIVMTQSMSFSPFKKPFEERISTWESKLRTTQDVLDEWLLCQRQWLYLEPIFSSDDINRQLPVESKRYQTMERLWRKIMKDAKENPQVITLCPDNRLLDNLRECNKLLEQVQKGLSDYLETKRNSFPRFYFLSDDELLEILSQTKDPTAVQPHLRKCFENIARITFEEDLKITKMESGEGEVVPFKKDLYPRGNVEDWLLEVEEVMKESLRLILLEAIADYSKKKRTEWVLVWPGQVVIAVCQLFWTKEVTQALEDDELPSRFKILLQQLDDLRELVRGSLSKIARQVLSALIVIEVHARDVVNKMLDEEVKNANDFEWISQLRYYWLEDDNLYIRAVNAQFLYGYEYLGNTGRLVITPLTDRCYLTLTWGATSQVWRGAGRASWYWQDGDN
ncbi:hypothetical protein NP493_1117g00049 [Ridgeia piscesae]|uniref:Dynein heavy chain n=1 Tax=Ridgeia piscesae TaxID=27915 RepID=A0AAD9KH25_RIDPI|nr:hypothetical protein NP493_1117g00049 [Ridgeia piscesae]